MSRAVRKHMRFTGKVTMLYLEAELRENGGVVTSYVDVGYLIKDDSITCLKCGMTSHNPNDVSAKYCAQCKRYHEDPLELPAPKEVG